MKRIIKIDPEANASTYCYSKKPTKHCSPTDLKRRKLNKNRDYAVVIEWLEVFTDEESDGEVKVPLINKRTRRRKQHICSVTEDGAPSVSIKKNEIRIETEFGKHGTEDKFAINESLNQNENLSRLGSKCTNEVVEVSDG
jgi:hypothetical protein